MTQDSGDVLLLQTAERGPDIDRRRVEFASLCNPTR